ncbi:unnamed protein product [Adineta ricciae]|uniref:DUF4326 domain-containing protein n=1 Tax=Adineta ricciae TaxID=249248 RepID=A0A815AM23_ADIRI|nr:unnamed protein product [Adineta ricciae]
MASTNGNKHKPTDETQPVLPVPPTVVHLRRAKGKVVQDCDVYIARACNMGGWNLPQKKFRKHIESNENNLLNDLHELEGKRLGCWCKPKPCHGDILCELFKREIQQSAKKISE